MSRRSRGLAHSGILSLMAAGAALAYAWHSLRASSRLCYSDECVYLNNALLFLRTGKLQSSLHLDGTVVDLGFSHGGWHSSAAQLLTAIVTWAGGTRIDALWWWSCALILAATLLFVRSSPRGQRGLLALGALLFPSIWIWTRFSTAEITILGLSLLSLTLWVRAVSDPSLRRIIPFGLLGGVSVYFRQVELIPFLTGLLLWRAWRPPGRRPDGGLASTGAWGLIGAFVLFSAALNRLLNPDPPPWFPVYTGRLQAAILDLSIVKGLFTGQFSFSEVWELIRWQAADNFAAFVLGKLDLSTANTTYRLWVILVFSWSFWAIVRKGARTPVLLYGFLGGVATFSCLFVIYHFDEFRPLRLLHSMTLAMLLGLLQWYAGAGRLPRQAILLLAVTGLTSLHQVVQPIPLPDPDGPPREAFGQVSDRLAIPAGHDPRLGILYYDFTTKLTLGFDHAVKLQYLINGTAHGSGAPLFRLQYSGFSSGFSAGERDAVLQKMAATGNCPDLAVVHPESPLGAEQLQKACGAYRPISTFSGRFWQAPLLVRSP